MSLIKVAELSSSQGIPPVPLSRSELKRLQWKDPAYRERMALARRSSSRYMASNISQLKAVVERTDWDKVRKKVWMNTGYREARSENQSLAMKRVYEENSAYREVNKEHLDSVRYLGSLAKVGIPLSSHCKKRISEALMGIRLSPLHKQHISEARKGMVLGETHCQHISEVMRGNRHWNWKGGCSMFRGDDWRWQRNTALRRDNYTCQDCGRKRDSAHLAVHHLVPYRISESNSLENLVTLCQSCHMKREYQGLSR